MKVWTIDERFGDRKAAVPDTLSYMFMNEGLTTGLRGEYNVLGNLGSPRQNRIFIDRTLPSERPNLRLFLYPSAVNVPSSFGIEVSSVCARAALATSTKSANKKVSLFI